VADISQARHQHSGEGRGANLLVAPATLRKAPGLPPKFYAVVALTALVTFATLATAHALLFSSRLFA
jgi:hypothetical protein